MIVLVLLTLTSCKSLPVKDASITCPTWNEASLIYASQSTAKRALDSKTRREKKADALKAIDWAEKCVASYPQSDGCETALSDARKVFSLVEKRLTTK